MPQRLSTAAVELEAHLEEWIERDPSLLASGLEVVGRQVQVAAGRIDLLAIDPQGRWVVIEIKRGVTERETLAQAIDYAACIAALSGEEIAARVEAYGPRRGGRAIRDVLADRGLDIDDLGDREVIVYLVGTGRSDGLERMTDFLRGRFDVPIVTVSFDVFQTPGGERVLVRELDEQEAPQVSRSRPRLTVDDILGRIVTAGFEAEVEAIRQEAGALGLTARPYKQSVMYAPERDLRRCLFTVYIPKSKDDGFWAYVAQEAFAEFFDVTAERTLEVFPDDWNQLDGQTDGFFDRIRSLVQPAGNAISDTVLGAPAAEPRGVPAE
ncbi:MAG TPA: endonuclease NucS domain-containing protein [Rhodothermales bacterium]|nr:endonuclease NucS domain-containing protein [Rhodothermales bacterium]